MARACRTLVLVGLAYVRADLHAAADANDPAGVNHSLAGGANINELGADGLTAFHRAVTVGKFRSARALHQNGADTTIGDPDGLTAMHVAAKKGDPRIVKWLIKLGQPMSTAGKDGFTPLHRACWGAAKQHTDTVWAFLEAGVPPDEASADGKTCYDMAGNENTRRLLGEALSELQRDRRRGSTFS